MIGHIPFFKEALTNHCFIDGVRYDVVAGSMFSKYDKAVLNVTVKDWLYIQREKYIAMQEGIEWEA